MSHQTTYATTTSLTGFYKAPTAISELPTKRSVRDIYFPAVALCHPSRFQRARLMELANFVFANQNATGKIVGQTWEDVFRVVKSLIYLLDLSIPSNPTDTIRLHNMLTEYYNGSYPIESMLRLLSPSCDVWLALLERENGNFCSLSLSVCLSF